MVDIKKFIKYNRITIAILILALLLIVVPITYSKFQSLAASDKTVQTAFYLINSEYQTAHIKIDELIPQDEPYIYNFTVSNFNDNQRCETDMEYTIKIKTTTNLPLNYILYKNQTYNDPNKVSIITEEIVETDEYGTYFKSISTPVETFIHTANQSNNYQLVINFPGEYTNPIYQDIIEGIFITIETKQIIE